jgi:hypothetical protein
MTTDNFPEWVLQASLKSPTVKGYLCHLELGNIDICQFWSGLAQALYTENVGLRELSEHLAARSTSPLVPVDLGNKWTQEAQ